MLGDVTQEDIENDPEFGFWYRFRVLEYPTEPFTRWPLSVVAAVEVCDRSFFKTGEKLSKEENVE